MFARWTAIQQDEHAPFASKISHDQGEEVVYNECLKEQGVGHYYYTVADHLLRGPMRQTHLVDVTDSIDSECSVEREE